MCNFGCLPINFFFFFFFLFVQHSYVSDLSIFHHVLALYFLGKKKKEAKRIEFT